MTTIEALQKIDAEGIEARVNRAGKVRLSAEPSDPEILTYLRSNRDTVRAVVEYLMLVRSAETEAGRIDSEGVTADPTRFENLLDRIAGKERELRAVGVSTEEIEALVLREVHRVR